MTKVFFTQNLIERDGLIVGQIVRASGTNDGNYYLYLVPSKFLSGDTIGAVKCIGRFANRRAARKWATLVLGTGKPTDEILDGCEKLGKEEYATLLSGPAVPAPRPAPVEQDPTSPAILNVGDIVYVFRAADFSGMKYKVDTCTVTEISPKCAGTSSGIPMCRVQIESDKIDTVYRETQCHLTRNEAVAYGRRVLERRIADLRAVSDNLK